MRIYGRQNGVVERFRVKGIGRWKTGGMMEKEKEHTLICLCTISLISPEQYWCNFNSCPGRSSVKKRRKD